MNFWQLLNFDIVPRHCVIVAALRTKCERSADILTPCNHYIADSHHRLGCNLLAGTPCASVLDVDILRKLAGHIDELHLKFPAFCNLRRNLYELKLMLT